MAKPIRVAIVDDSALMRRMLTEALSAEPGSEVVGHAADPFEARADSSSITNTTSAQGAGEVDAEATTEADSGRAGRDRSAAERWRAGDRAGAWPLAQRDQYGDRAGTGRQLRRRPSAGRGGSAAGDAGPGWQPPVCRGGEAAAATAGADRGAASGGWNGNVVRTTSEAIYQAVYAVPRGELRRELLACQGKPQRGPRMANGGAGSATASANGRRRWRVPGHWEGDLTLLCHTIDGGSRE
jgi:hypothetical protein